MATPTYAPLTNEEMFIADQIGGKVTAAILRLEQLQASLGYDERAMSRKRWIVRKIAELSDISASIGAWK